MARHILTHILNMYNATIGFALKTDGATWVHVHMTLKFPSMFRLVHVVKRPSLKAHIFPQHLLCNLRIIKQLSRLPPMLVPLLVWVALGGRLHRLSSCHRSTFLFPFVMSWVYTPGSHYVIIISLFNPLVLIMFCVWLFLVCVSLLC